MMSKAAGKRLAKHRHACGLRLDDAAVRTRDLVGPHLGVSRETIRRYEVGRVPPEHMDPVTLTILAEVYNTTLAELAPWVDRDELHRFREVLERRSWDEDMEKAS